MALNNNNYNQAVLDKVNRPHKKRSSSNQTVIVFVLVIVIILLFVIGLSLRGGDNNSQENSDNNTSPTPIASPTVEPTLADTEEQNTVILDITGDNDPEVTEDTVYYVSEGGEDKLFYLVSGFDEDDNVIYEGYMTTGNYSFEPQEYDELDNPIRLTSLSDSLTYVVDFSIADDNSEMYLSAVVRLSDFVEENILYRIDLQSKDTEEVWSRILHDESYEDLYGALSINATIDEWMEASLLECFGCDGDVNFGVLIINTNTGRDLLLGDAENLTFDTDGKTIDYTVAGERKSTTLP